MQQQPLWNRLSLNYEDIDFIEDFNRVINDQSIQDIDERPQSGDPSTDPTPDAYDTYLGMEIGLPREDDDHLLRIHVKRRAIDVDGNPVGVCNDNPLLDTRLYEIEYLDGTMKYVSANIIAENLLAQVDDEGHRQLLLSEIIDNRISDDAIRGKDGYITSSNGARRRIKTTHGWELCVEWKDGGTDWITLKDLKHAYPVQLANHAIHNNI